MRIILAIVLVFLFSHNCFSQISFDLLPPINQPEKSDIVKVSTSSIAFSDIDGDLDLDLIVTGLDSNFQEISILYENNGIGEFDPVSGTVFADVSFSSVIFGDVDNDNDEDLLITGRNSSNQPISELYLNDGTGNFTLSTSSSFTGVFRSSVAFADVDGDNDLDVLMTGENSSSIPVSELYLNDSLGNFTLVPNTPFVGVKESDIAFADVDGDNDMDVLISGENSSNTAISELYLNNGAGVFSLDTAASFIGVERSSVAFEDVDGDNDVDLLLAGDANAIGRVARLYINDGSGSFTFVSMPFTAVRWADIAFSDVDGDNDQDVVISGRNGTTGTTRLYTNDGNGIFTYKQTVFGSGPSRYGAWLGSIAFADIDGDNDDDLFVTGRDYLADEIADLYTNDGSGNFSLVNGSTLTGVGTSSSDVADVDNDNDLDIIITGQDENLSRVADLYSNDGNGNFVLNVGSPFVGVGFSGARFADIDGDLDPDLLLAGGTVSSLPFTGLYSNNGSGSFIPSPNQTIDSVRFASLEFADIDADLDQDVLITGHTASGGRISHLYANDGNGNFALVSNTPFDSVSNGSLAFADIDGDLDQDVLITGNLVNGSRVASIFSNNGNGLFTKVLNTPFPGIAYSAVAFADVDGDLDMDVLITGESSQSQKVAELYKNDGLGNFTLVSGTPFIAVYKSSIAFGDIDGDSDLDVLITGSAGTNNPSSNLYLNDGIGNFSSPIDTLFEHVYIGSINLFDIDGDNKLDILLTGANAFGEVVSHLYKNTSCYTTSIDTHSACSTFTWIDGNTYTSSNNSAVHILTNSVGCDSIISLDLTILETSASDTIIACDSYTWIDGNTYTSSNDSATFIMTNAVGCDSTITLDLTILNSSSRIDTVRACNSYTWIDGNTYTSSNNSATVQFTNVAGCDSTIILDLIINSTTYGNAVVTACDSYTWIDGNTYTTSNNSAIDTIVNSMGCDSIVSLNLTILTSSSSTDVIIACDSYTWINGITYSSSNNSATFTLTNSSGCDSIVMLDLTINNSSSQTDNVVACYDYTWIDGVTYSSSNNSASVNFINTKGCDSTINLNLTIIEIDTTISSNLTTLSVQSGYSSYQWLDCNAGFSPIPNAVFPEFTPDSSGSYAVIINEQNCSDTSNCRTMSVISGINETIPSHEFFQVFPNPNTGIFFIEFFSNPKHNSVQIFDLTGKKVLEHQITGSTMQVEASSLPAGMYEVRIGHHSKRLSIVR